MVKLGMPPMEAITQTARRVFQALHASFSDDKHWHKVRWKPYRLPPRREFHGLL